MKKHESQAILVAIRLAHASWRDFLSGFLDAARDYPHWSLRIVDPETVPEMLNGGDVRGLVIGDIGERAAALLTQYTFPTVVIGSQSTRITSRRTNIAFVHNDDEDIGREGARILRGLGSFSCHAFVPHADGTHWSALRARGFVSEAKPHGDTVSVYRLPATGDPVDGRMRLLRWLQALPKPAAVMAACDATALEVIDLCKEAKIRIPEQIAVLGVDNDRLLCESARPAISSIAPDHFHEGELAAKALAELFRRRTSRPKTILCSRKKSVMRESTKPTKPAAALLRHAMEFIADHAAAKITVTDVARHLGVSRQLVELRFREFGEKTLAATIRDTRLAEVRRQLRTTHLPIRTIAANCGWTNVNHLENAFKRRFGISMRQQTLLFLPTT